MSSLQLQTYHRPLISICYHSNLYFNNPLLPLFYIYLQTIYSFSDVTTNNLLSGRSVLCSPLLYRLALHTFYNSFYPFLCFLTCPRCSSRQSCNFYPPVFPIIFIRSYLTCFFYFLLCPSPNLYLLFPQYHSYTLLYVIISFF